MDNKTTKPEVFIIESLTRDDVENGRCEGDLIAKILKMGGRNPKYLYAQTLDEFRQALATFSESNYRYLHISSHGADNHFLFQFGEIYFNQFSVMVRDILSYKRVFVSACEAVSHNDHELANAVMRNTRCSSLIGSAEPIDFDDAAMFWSTFYYLAYQNQEEETKIDRKLILDLLEKLTVLYPLKINYYSYSRRQGIKLDRFIEGRKWRL